MKPQIKGRLLKLDKLELAAKRKEKKMKTEKL